MVINHLLNGMILQVWHHGVPIFKPSQEGTDSWVPAMAVQYLGLFGGEKTPQKIGPLVNPGVAVGA